MNTLTLCKVASVPRSTPQLIHTLLDMRICTLLHDFAKNVLFNDKWGVPVVPSDFTEHSV